MKILHVQKMGKIAGSENYLLEIVPSLKKNGIDVEFLCIYNKGNEDLFSPFIAKLERNKVKVHLIPVKNFPTFKTLQQIYRLIKNGKYDLIHTHLIHADFFLAMVKFFFNRRLILVSTKHGYEESYNNDFGFAPQYKKNNTYFFICKLSERFINRSYAISNGLKNFFVQTGIASATKMDMIHYGFNFSDAVLDPEKEKYRFGSPQLVIVGRLVKFKGHRFLLNSLNKIIEAYPNLKLVIVGSGNLEEALKKKVYDLSLENYVVFTGHQPNIHDYMSNSDLVIIPSVSEGFGVVFLEALNNKKPVVAFNVPAANEIIENGKSGVLVKPFEEESLAQSIMDLLKHKEKGEALIEGGYKRLKGYFNLDRMTQETIEFYNKVLK